jgi:mono/diheme cytochrome c family protein
MAAVRDSARALASLAISLAAICGCGDSPGLHDRLHDELADDGAGTGGKPGAMIAGRGGKGGDEPDAGGGEPSAADCVPAVSSDALRARSSVMARGLKAGASGVFVTDLFGLFQSNCGGCHVDNSLGGFHVSLATFPSVVTSKALERISSDEPDFYMPPEGSGGKPFSERGPGDPIYEFAGLLEAWLAAGKPTVFYPESGGGAGSDPNRYLLSERVGTQMTNLGNCIPKAKMVLAAAQQEDELDAMFEKATELPDRLDQTDLTSLDAEVLAQKGVVAFAPAYTLWADNAKKVRMVRVPRGESIVFDEEKQSFTIPANTRFYKTFLKRVVDLHGNESYRKMETRLIVSRPDKKLKDGSTQYTALFGTYAWNEAETEAVLVRDPLRNGQPFRDRLVTYVTDEQAADALITTGPDDLQRALQDAGLSRTYAIPGSERCIQCHMGAPTESFVLGFSPLQLHRRKIGEGGVIEPAARDELHQLQRLIDYGVITGMKSPDDVVLLEDSEGERKPRNDHELSAQGYMLGNCSHCHNPGGYPSRVAPELRDLLNFFPSKDGGIFQFPLEKYSPRILRGVFQNVPQPYITPSLYDRTPGTDLPAHPPDPAIPVGEAGGNYLKKVYVLADGETSFDLVAPWRSLIYRNVDTPFTYEEDFSIYPHMPMNTPGYDCRARQLLGSWMVSIPAKLKPWEKSADPNVGAIELEASHPEAQPFVEVLPGDSDYARQQRAAEARVTRFEDSLRYVDCPDPIKTDIVDPAVQRGEILVPRPLYREVLDGEGALLETYSLRTPERPHYAVTDLTNPPGDWFPRRPDWSAILVDLDFTGVDALLQERVQVMHGVTISDALRAIAITDVPFGRWKVKDGCDLGEQPKLSDFAGDARPRWADAVNAKDDDRVYMISPGAEIFTQICSNCHGPNADSQGRLAATIADMTGGQTRVANLRDGFFGPTDEPGKNRERVFSGIPGGESAETWAARYLMFMGLGGTQRTIPTPALQTIRNGTVLGEKRPDPSGLDVSTANMLSVPLALCKAVIPGAPTEFALADGDLDYTADKKATPLIEHNGDLAMWQTLCVLDNDPMPVRVVKLDKRTDETVRYEVSNSYLRRASAYPAGALVGVPRGAPQLGIQPGNAAPWCVQRSDTEVFNMQFEAEWAKYAGSDVAPPYCPDAFLKDANGVEQNIVPADELDRWAARGAMNAGMAVFLYLEALAKGEKQRPVPYDHCEQLAD